MPDSKSTWFGHPRGLLSLCVSEGWERFSYFGMQSLMVLYMTHYLLQPEQIGQVVGIGVVRSAIEWFTGPLSTAALSSQIFGLYTGFVYMTPVLGGLVADRWVNRTLTVTIGALLMVAGHFLMAFEASFFFAIGLLLVGVGCFKGNIAGQVGELYDRGDLRRADAYQIFQLTIAFAVVVSPLVVGTLGEKVGWHWGFAAAGVGMVAGLASYLGGRKWLPEHSTREVSGPTGSERDARIRRMTRAEWKVVLMLVALLPVIAASMLANQQMFNAFVIWSETTFDLNVMGYEIPVTWLLSFDAGIAVFFLTLAIVFWREFGKRWKEPEDIVKIAIGAVVMTMAPLLLAAAAMRHQAVGEPISIAWALGFEVFNEIGFALIAPVGLSLFSRAAPKQVEGLTIGLFYLSFFLCNVVVGRLGGMLETMNGATFWVMHAAVVAASAVVLAALARWGRALFRPVEDHAAPAG